MGCGQSKVDSDEELPPALRHHPAVRRFWLRARCDRERKGDYIRAEPMLPEGSDMGDDVVSVTDKKAVKAGSPLSPVEEEGEMNDGSMGGGEDVEKNLRMIRNRREEEGLPGSPSFRFYFEKGAQTKWEEAGKAGEDNSQGTIDDHQKKAEDTPNQGEDHSKSLNSPGVPAIKSAKKAVSILKNLTKGSNHAHNNASNR